ncbi:MAG TPA: efflux RND transporter periplasmic adaptor subunit, partial [Candidatus Mailhella excrementigallinarum]|nr:efflux RND transporter periplasmic adaptor subunit [Candidatus Mailhella excrementigallinarum]
DVTFSVPERYLPEVRGLASESSLRVTARTKDDTESEGELTFIGNVDSATGTVPLKARFPNTDGKMWPGEYARITLRLRLLKDAVTVPSRAVTIGPDGTFVYVVGDDMKARYRLVSTSVEHNGVSVVTGGLEAGEKVVMEGHVRLADGIDVRFPSVRTQAEDKQPATPGAAS